jgi:hypothetical protein
MIAAMTFRSVLAAAAITPAAICALCAAPSAARAAEMSRAEIDAARARIEQTYQAKVRECNARFVVTGCLEDARNERIRALRPLDRAEHQVNAEDRQRRAAAAKERVQQKERDAAADEAQRKTQSVREAAQPASAVPAAPMARTPRANPELHQRRQAQQEAEAKAEAARRREAAAQRREKAQERQHKASQMQARYAEKAASAASAATAGGKNTKPPAAHLPTPSASDIRALPKH